MQINKPMIHSKFLIHCCICLIATVLYFPGFVEAGDTIEEIIVTAEKHEETLQETPISITALTAKAMDVRGIEDITQLSNYVPNLNLLSSTAFGGSSTSFAFIRGVGQPEVFVQNDPGVGIYVDGVYIGRSQGSIFDVLDLQRIEVLRGPQGTLYGRNTIGGAINLISAPPTDQRSASVELQAGNFSQFYGKAKINGPLSDRVLASAAFSLRRHDGFVKANPHPVCGSCSHKALTDDDTFAGRVSFRILATDNLTFDLAGDYSKKDNLPIGRRLVYSVIDPGLPQYNDAVQYWWGAGVADFVNSKYNTHSSNITGYDRQKVRGISLTAEWKRDQTTFKSITGYRKLDVHHSSDSDGSPMVINTIVPEIIDQHQFSQEFQLHSTALDGQLEWLLGAFGMKEDVNSSIDQAQAFAEMYFGVLFPPPTFMPVFFPPAPDFDPNAPPYFGRPPRTPDVTALTTDNYAIFGHTRYQITEMVGISLGLRFSHERKHFQFHSNAFGTSFDLTDSWNSLTPRVGLELQASDDVLWYVSYSEGFKSGTFNNGNDPSQPLSVKPEEVKAYELGAKTSWLDKRMTLNIAAYYSDYTNQQLQVRTNTQFQQFAFVNVGASEIKGGEIELALQPNEYLRIDGGLGYTDSKITKVDVNTPNVDKGARLVRTPKVSLNLGASLTMPVTGSGHVEIRVDYAYKSSQEGDFTNNPHDRVGSYNIANVRASYQPESGRWEVYLFAQNVFDKEYELARAGFDPTVSASAVDGPPRVYGAGLKISY